MFIYNDKDGLFTVYLIINNLNNRKYIGVHKEQPGEDLRTYMGSGTAIIAAIEKYGVENFTKIILARFDNRDSMVAMEADLVSQDMVESPEYYNLKTGGDYGLHSEETREKMSVANIGKTLNKETREKISASLKDKPRSEETRSKIAAAHKGKHLSEDTRVKISDAMKGKKRGPKSKETREKMSASKKGVPQGPRSKETREKMSASRRGKKRGSYRKKTRAK